MIKLSVPAFWRKRSLLSYLLLPLSWIFCSIIWLRRLYYKYLFHSDLSVPVIVVGNITVGGAGKTPLVIYLVNLLKRNGYKPGVISRGYGRLNKRGLILVKQNSSFEEVGDEPLLIFRKTNCPVLVDSNRLLAAKELLEKHGCNIIISDDGLQHYKLSRMIEIAVVDADFEFGNGFCFPAGPLREPVSRLNSVDFVIRNFGSIVSDKFKHNMQAMFLETVNIRKVSDSTLLDDFSIFNRGLPVHAVVGIGNPNKFFDTLRQSHIDFIPHIFPDHHRFQSSDFPFINEIIIMTEKDAVKCARMANNNFWYLEVSAKLNKEFDKDLLNKIKK